MSEDRPWTRPVRHARHPTDGGCLFDHPIGGSAFAAHSHEIKEAWPHEQKQAVGAHIDRWHFYVNPRRES